MTLFDGSVAYAGPTFSVNSTRDAVDANPGDGVCQTKNANECTLRAAIMELNALPVGEDADIGTVILASGGIYTLTIKGANDDAGRSGDLDVRNLMIITSSSPGPAIVQGSSGWNDRIFHIVNVDSVGGGARHHKRDRDPEWASRRPGGRYSDRKQLRALIQQHRHCEL
jgi:CSLREA domain-containing protein